ncbi:MAG: hypothetical protein ACR2K5_07315 [Pseudolabrys sp.]
MAVIATTGTGCRAALLALCIGMALSGSSALAQQAAPPVAQQPAPAPTQQSAQEPARESRFGPFRAIARWFDESFTRLGSNFKSAKGGVDNFNREAGIAAKTTVDAASAAAGAVARLPKARTISGHQTCVVASNGGPDCITAATTMCTAQGFKGGQSVDMTSAEECPAAVMLGRRAAEPGECKTVTFVTRALCQ